jgi:hypothetical protein
LLSFNHSDILLTAQGPAVWIETVIAYKYLKINMKIVCKYLHILWQFAGVSPKSAIYYCGKNTTPAGWPLRASMAVSRCQILQFRVPLVTKFVPR